jgi:short chain dehydrogenase
MNQAEFSWSTFPRKGVRVLLTGAAGGLGQGLQAALDQVGAQTVGLDRPGSSGLEGARLIEADLADPVAARKAVASAGEMLGGLDAVVGAAAIVDTIHRAATFPDDAFRSDVDVNLTAQFTLAQAAHSFLCASKNPAIVFVASQAGLDGLPGQAAYAAAKAGLIGLTTSLATRQRRCAGHLRHPESAGHARLGARANAGRGSDGTRRQRGGNRRTDLVPALSSGRIHDRSHPPAGRWCRARHDRALPLTSVLAAAWER